jgi:hypothetical protein
MGHTPLIFLMNVNDSACDWRVGRVPFLYDCYLVRAAYLSGVVAVVVIVTFFQKSLLGDGLERYAD